MALLSRPRRGLSLVELIAVVAVTGLLVALLLPAIGRAREAAARTTCSSRLKQMGIAVASYEGAWGALPPRFCEAVGTLGHPYSAQCRLLPYLEREDVYALLNLNAPAYFERTFPADHPNYTAALCNISTLLCPSDGLAKGRANSYRFCAGTGPFWKGTTLVATNWDEPITIAYFNRRDRDFVDGRSQTALMSERLVGDFDDKSFTPGRDALGPTGPPTPGALQPFLAPCAASAQTAAAILKHYSWHGATWSIGSSTMTMYNHAFTPNSIVTDCGSSRDQDVFSDASTARSNHPGGVNLLSADGSLSFVTDSVAPAIWLGMATCRGGEIGTH